METADFFANQRLRTAIYRREKQRCFYCGKKLHYGNRTLDHVLARAEGGGNGYRNVVACCVECNSGKGSMSGAQFLHALAKRGVLAQEQSAGRKAALKALQEGRMRPSRVENRAIAA